MKYIFLCLPFMILSCFTSQKEYVRPAIEFRLYDIDSKKPIEGMELYLGNGSTTQYEKYKDLSDNKGRINVEPVFYENKTNRKLFPPANTRFVFKKNNYSDKEISLFEYFKVNANSAFDKKYVSDSIFIGKKQ